VIFQNLVKFVHVNSRVIHDKDCSNLGGPFPNFGYILATDSEQVLRRKDDRDSVDGVKRSKICIQANGCL